MDSRWEIKPLTLEQEKICQSLSKELNISLVAASLLVRRGLCDAESARAFIRPQLDDKYLHDPFLMKDMDRAVERLTTAINNREKILVYGDYDVDGTTAVALMYQFLKGVIEQSLSQSIDQNPESSTEYGLTRTTDSLLDFYIPDRYTEGYGISFKGIDNAQEAGATLIVALDCGIRSVEHVEYAAERGIDFIICDHHLPGADIPKAVAVLDAKRADSGYPFKELCGCGVGYKLAHAYSIKHNLNLSNLEPLLPLVAMAIASDIVPIVDENRVLAYYGIKILNKKPSAGIRNLMRIAGVEHGRLDINDLVFKIGPRINACGRIHSGKDAVRLLITQDENEAAKMSEKINEHNSTRKELDQLITNQALLMLEQDPDNDKKFSTVVCGEGWHKGVVGIVASRLIDKYYRPTIVLTKNDDIVSGSARSVGGFDVYSAIDSCSDLLTNFGGHIYAAGLSMKAENLPAFIDRFECYVSNHILPEQRQPVLLAEAEINFEDITNQFFKILQCLEPFGPGNPRPIFVTKNVFNYRYTRSVGKNGEHLKLDVADGTGFMQGIAFGKGEYAIDLMNGKNFDICYEIQSNVYNGVTTKQMMVQEIRPHQPRL